MFLFPFPDPGRSSWSLTSLYEKLMTVTMVVTEYNDYWNKVKRTTLLKQSYGVALKDDFALR